MSPDTVDRIARETVIAALKEDIGRRIRPVISHLPEAEICALVERMAFIQYKYEGDRSYLRTPTDRRFFR
jgi:hypothetical protein